MGSLAFDAPDAPEGRALDPARLVDLVRTNVDEDGWRNDRNSIEVRGDTLVVVQTPAVQAQVDAYLERLRALRGREGEEEEGKEGPGTAVEHASPHVGRGALVPPVRSASLPGRRSSRGANALGGPVRETHGVH